MPAGKIVVLGLVASKVNELETAELLKRRIEEASRYIKLDQLGSEPAMRLLHQRGRAHRR